MLPHLLGSLALLAAAALLALTLLVASIALIRRSYRTVLFAAAAAGTIITVYGVGLLLPLYLVPSRVLPPGAELAFCGLDCHLHVAVVAARALPADTSAVRYAVTLRVRSNAVREPEHPDLLDIVLVDGAGRVYDWQAQDSLGSPFREPLGPGQQYRRTLTFALPAGATPAGLRITWRSGLDLLVLGPGNTMLRRRTLLALPRGDSTP